MVENYTWLQNSIEKFLVERAIKQAEIENPDRNVFATCSVGFADEIEVCVTVKPQYNANKYKSEKSKLYFTPREALLAFIAGEEK